MTLEMPAQVRRAVILLSVSLLAAIIDGFGELKASALDYAVYFGTFGLMALTIYFVSRRQNWARFVALLLTIAGVAAAFWLPHEDASFRELAMEIGFTAAEVLALYWLFTGPGAAWFSKRTAGAS